MARWSDWESLGDAGLFGAAITSRRPKVLDCFVVHASDEAARRNRHCENILARRTWAPGWGDWDDIGPLEPGTGNAPQMHSNPAAISSEDARIDVVVAAERGALFHGMWRAECGWSRNWTPLGATVVSAHAGAAALSSWSPNRLDCFYAGRDGDLQHLWGDGSTWFGPESLGGALRSAPAAVSWGRDRIDVFAIGVDGALCHTWWDGSGRWSSWEGLGGCCREGVAVASWGPHRLDCFVVGNDRAMYHRWWDGSGRWSDWERRGGELHSAPAAVSWGPDRIDVVARGNDDQIWHTWWS